MTALTSVRLTAALHKERLVAILQVCFVASLMP